MIQPIQKNSQDPDMVEIGDFNYKKNTKIVSDFDSSNSLNNDMNFHNVHNITGIDKKKYYKIKVNDYHPVVASNIMNNVNMKSGVNKS